MPKAEKRTGGRPKKGDEKPVADLPQVMDRGKARAKAAADLDVSPRQVQKAKAHSTNTQPHTYPRFQL